MPTQAPFDTCSPCIAPSFVAGRLPAGKKETMCINEQTMGAEMDSYAVLADFYGFFGFPDVKEDLWYCVATALSKDGSLYDDGVERSHLLFLYEKISKLLDATYAIVQEKKVDKQY